MGLLPILLMFVLLYFVMIRPQQRRARAHRELVASISAGDEVELVGPQGARRASS